MSLLKPCRLAQHLGPLPQREVCPPQLVVRGTGERPSLEGHSPRPTRPKKSHLGPAATPARSPGEPHRERRLAPSRPTGRHAWPHVERGCLQQARQGPTNVGPGVAPERTQLRRTQEEHTPLVIAFVAASSHALRQYREVHAEEEGIHQGLSRPSERWVGKSPAC